MKRLLLLAIILLNFPRVFACLILFISDGKEILVANHEDWLANDAEVTFVPGSEKHFGMLYFNFASEGAAQGGMNTAGLFFDGTATHREAYNDNLTREDCHCYVWTKILAECSSVEQAISYLERYRIPEMDRVHIMFADSLGKSAVIGVYNGKLAIHKNSNRYQLLTNFNLSLPNDNKERLCSRFNKAKSLLNEDSSATVSNLKKVLSKTHQEGLTVYSNIYNLTKREVLVYMKRDFTREVKINLSEELKKGKHSVRIFDLFK